MDTHFANVTGLDSPSLRCVLFMTALVELPSSRHFPKLFPPSKIPAKCHELAHARTQQDRSPEDSRRANAQRAAGHNYVSLSPASCGDFSVFDKATQRGGCRHRNVSAAHPLIPPPSLPRCIKRGLRGTAGHVVYEREMR